MDSIELEKTIYMITSIISFIVFVIACLNDGLTFIFDVSKKDVQIKREGVKYDKRNQNA